MKVTQIFGLVLVFHVVAIGLILFQPGCQTRPPPPPPPGAPTSVQNVATAPTAASRSAYTPPAGQETPTRPGASRPGTASSSSSGDRLEDDFNAGFLPAADLGGPVLQPTVNLSAYDDDDYAPSARSSSAPSKTYRVVAGDNLSKIARTQGVTVDDLKRANGLTSSTIRVGDELIVPGAGESTPTSTSSLDAAGSTVYKIAPGDSLSRIASRHGVTVAELRAANGLTSDLIKVGDELYIPSGGTSAPRASTAAPAASASAASGATYTVQAGDTPGGIARRYGVDHRELMRINGVTDPSKLRVGQVLVIPGGGTAPTTAATPAPATRPTVAASAPAPAARPTTPAATPSRPATLTPQPSRPALIGSPADATPDPMSDLDRLENDDLPMLEAEVIDPEGQ